MALATYDDLRVALASWLNRTDLDATIPDFITLASAQIARDVRHWRQISADLSFDIASRFVTLPTDWLQTIRVNVASNKPPLALSSVAEMQDLRATNGDAVGTPTNYTHMGATIEVYPTPDDTYTGEFHYYAKVPDLAENQTNWLFTYAPDVYLYGALVQSAPFLQHDERTAQWASLYSAAVTRLNQESEAAMWSGTGLRMRGRM